MFTYIRLKNFMSFGDITFNFRKNAKTAKNFIALYGENGCGKSNFVKSIDFLCDSNRSIFDFENMQRSVSQLQNKFAVDDGVVGNILSSLSEQWDFQEKINSCRMIDCDAPAEAEYGFLIGGQEWTYLLKFTDRIVEEKLYGMQDKVRGVLYHISENADSEIKMSFWGRFFTSADVREEFEAEIRKYWGKHTFLSIFTNLQRKLNVSYVRTGVTERIFQFSATVNNRSVCQTMAQRNEQRICSAIRNFSIHLDSGRIKEDSLPYLERAERILNTFFTQSYADIKNVEYEITKISESKYEYQLYLDKMIAGKIRRINFTRESAGTQRVLDVFRIILDVFFGGTVVYDEIDNGIHDLLLKNIIDCARPYITGQLIITTHNTLLLESIDKHSAYLINVDYEGNKEAICFDEYKIQGTDNMRIKYLKGLFGGTPYGDGVDYDEIISELKEAGEDEENDEVTD